MTPKPRAWLPVLAAAVYVAFLVWQAPHTVHHFFERDTEKPNECAFSAAAERSAGGTVASAGLAPVDGVELPVVPHAWRPFAPPARSVVGPRAPPSLAA
jgi:hypothetical protein